ncbi:uncharacterized protein L3040_004493 [Drepanopeziza brunnea f. sp. 'multigermtubi']|uniref:uncharacterized protein n=1 Tax=Drepanopeziza brunnea f. sp. 'multigermtubi' TaxID=698441 RepID=UPI0023837C8A|nr:hypothetical protein L3040_004493 [Drepanopeziza brunnea f. sp. 'multigermtubi']
MRLLRTITNASSSHQNGAGAGADEEGGHELEGRDGLSVRGAEILNEIRIGSYTCVVCTDPIEFGRGQDYALWSCREGCHTVYHFRCIKDWSTASTAHAAEISSIFYINPPHQWKCPCCAATPAAINVATCWCGKRDHDAIAIGSANSCDELCAREGQCTHGHATNCQQKCHPGPCRLRCTIECRQILSARQSNKFRRFCTRVREKDKKPLAWAYAIFLLIYSGLGVFLHFHIRWNTMPWKYPGFERMTESTVLFILGMFLLLPALALLILGTCMVTFEFLISVFSLTLLDNNRPSGASVAGVLLGALFVCPLFLAIFTVPIVTLFEGPPLAWDYQMKDSCNGFNTRIGMDETPGTHFTALSLVPDQESRNFYLAERTDPSGTDASQPFRYYHRLSGSTSRFNTMAIDVDLHYHQWRMLSLSDSDQANQWLAYDSRMLDRSGFPSPPPFRKPSEDLIGAGSFTPTDDTHTTLMIPELELAITHMHQFIYKLKMEPFLRVFNVSGMKPFSRVWNTTDHYNPRAWNKKDRMHENEWTRRPHPREIMRTASFGRGRSTVTACAREVHEWRDMRGPGNLLYDANGTVIETPPPPSGVQMYHMVPFAIISAYRERVKETDLRPIITYKH